MGEVFTDEMRGCLTAWGCRGCLESIDADLSDGGVAMHVILTCLFCRDIEKRLPGVKTRSAGVRLYLVKLVKPLAAYFPKLKA